MTANSEFTWTSADTVLVYKLFVFHSSWILGQYERNIVLIYILRASSLSCHEKTILYRILRFFGVEESIWSGITNPFSDSPKEAHPFTTPLKIRGGFRIFQRANCKYKTTICYYFRDEKAIDTRSQTSSETSQMGRGGGGLQPPQPSPGSAPAKIRIEKVDSTVCYFSLNCLNWLLCFFMKWKGPTSITHISTTYIHLFLPSGRL